MVDSKNIIESSQIKSKDRDITYISPEELQFALLSILKHAIGITKDALIKDTAHAIGYTQAGSKITNCLSDAFDGLIKTKKIKLSPSGTVILIESK